jgi:hypothetical protein
MPRPPAPNAPFKEALAPVLARHPGLLLEDKGLTLALHYRQAPHLAAYAHRLMARVMQEAGGGLELQKGKRVIEIKPAGIDKGTAVAEYLAESPFRGRHPVFIGDDLNDEHGFAEVNRVGGISIKVGPGNELRPLSPASRRGCPHWLNERTERSRMNTLDLALIGNCTVGALVDARAKIVWGCFPRFDGDPVFCSLLRNTDDYGFSAIELADCERTEQHYLENTAILVTRLYDCHGGGIEVTDFAPRFGQYGRMFRPMMLVRRIRRLGGSPRLTLRVRPACNDGTARPEVTWGSNHIRYVTQGLTLRLTTDASLTAILQETAFFLEDTVTLLLGADESVHEAANEVGRRFLAETTEYWSEWVRFLGIPFEWQEAVIRAAITLKLNAYDDTGAIVAAMTTSIPEAAGSERNWDYRYCWVRDGYFVVNALNRLGATRTMERYLGYIVNVAANAGDGVLQPVYGIDGRAALDEREVPSLAGYRGMGPVRIGNLAYRQVQHDVYGSVILAATHIFFDQRLTRRGDEALFHRLEVLGEQARRCYDQPDAGLVGVARQRARAYLFGRDVLGRLRPPRRIAGASAWPNGPPTGPAMPR